MEFDMEVYRYRSLSYVDDDVSLAVVSLAAVSLAVVS